MTQRTIKFRAYDRENKRMLCPLSPVWFEENYWHDDDYAICANKAGFDLMQFTGLFDKAGKEVFEGDVLKTESGICEVKWYDKGACFRWMFNADSESPLNYDDREIIGNIYEHSHLLQ